jgi:sterol desaturase/sphingolipid hydroxylase (fatty acid hydroxylase superfamily)
VKRAERPVLITNAARSQAEQLRSRQRRYVLMMMTRAVCVVIFAVLVGTRPPLLPLWLVLTGVAAVLLPWLAVILANDGPPKDQHRLGHRRRAAATQAPTQRTLPGEPAPNRTIDADP